MFDAKQQKNIDRMMHDIDAEVRFTHKMTGVDTLSSAVIHAMQSVPRHKFVPTDMMPFAYHNGPLSIGKGQTISQPFIVALMTHLLAVDHESTVLEIGTGSGYQAAVLASIVKKVYSVEVIEALSISAATKFKELSINNIETQIADGYYGWQEHAPFDGIIVTAAAKQIPEPLISQLKCNAKLVIPVGYPGSTQDLVVVEKDSQGKVSEKSVLAVAFVPLTHANTSY